jgi:hypothetical protein
MEDVIALGTSEIRIESALNLFESKMSNNTKKLGQHRVEFVPRCLWPYILWD